MMTNRQGGHILGDALYLKWYYRENIDTYHSDSNLPVLIIVLGDIKVLAYISEHMDYWE